MRMKVYLAGRIRRERNRFGLPIEISLGDWRVYESHPMREFEFDTMKFLYTGPYTIGCDHSCAHLYSHAVGTPGCSDDVFFNIEGDGLETKLKQKVAQKSMQGIDAADVVFAWLSDDSAQAFGTLAEIGYAKGKGKKILAAHMPFDTNETWFAKTMADKVFLADTPIEAFREAMLWANTSDPLGLWNRRPTA